MPDLTRLDAVRAGAAALRADRLGGDYHRSLSLATLLDGLAVELDGEGDHSRHVELRADTGGRLERILEVADIALDDPAQVATCLGTIKRLTRAELEARR